MMDTVVELKVLSRTHPTKAFNSAFQIIHRIDSLASFTGTGDIVRINKGEKFAVSEDVIEIIKEGKKVSEMTDGAFDITVRPVMELWKDCKKGSKIPAKEEVDKILPLVNYNNIIIGDSTVEFATKGMKLDLSGIAKGYAIDLAVDALKSAGIKTGLVNAGGEVKVFGNKVFEIGIKHPRKEGMLKVLKLKNCAVATSGDYERYLMANGKRYHHILDPRTGFSADKCISVTIIADNSMFADAMATGVFVLGPERGKVLLDSLELRGIIITPEMKIIENEI